MTTYQKIISTLIVGLLILIFGMLIYGGVKSDSPYMIMQRLKKVDPDSLSQIVITPKNLDWQINLTLDTIKISDRDIIKRITDNLNQNDENYPGRGLRKTWEAELILDYKTGSDIRLIVSDASEGVCVFLTKTTGNPKFRCNGLKDILEDLSDYNGNVGKNKNAIQHQ